MAIPSKKSPEIERVIDKLLKTGRKESIKKNVCSWCGKEVTGFRDELSAREYTISGFCQQCQDDTFGK